MMPIMSFYATDADNQENCLICGWVGGRHRDGCAIPQAEKAIMACKTLMKFEWHIDGDEDSDETLYWQAVSEAREAVGDFSPAE